MKLIHLYLKDMTQQQMVIVTDTDIDIDTDLSSNMDSVLFGKVS